MRKLYDDDSVEGILRVDASNAFNNLNCQRALCNIQIICPAIATILLNTYRNNTSLFIDGETIHSCEGTTLTQGDPQAMYMYALATLPLIESLPEAIQQIWLQMTPEVEANRGILRSGGNPCSKMDQKMATVQTH